MTDWRILTPTGSYRLGRLTRAHIHGVHPRIVEAVELAITLTEQDFCVVYGGGVRSPEEAASNAARGTGVLNSLHIPQSDGYSHAVDLVAYVQGRPRWGKTQDQIARWYYPIREAMLQACSTIGLPIQHGADWDIDGVTGEKGEWDWPHFQIPKRPDRALAALKQCNEIRAALGLEAVA